VANARVNKLADFLERTIWTGIQAASGVALAYLTSGDPISWSFLGKSAGIAALIAVFKVIIGQRTGNDDTGAIAPGVKVVE